MRWGCLLAVGMATLVAAAPPAAAQYVGWRWYPVVPPYPYGAYPYPYPIYPPPPYVVPPAYPAPPVYGRPRAVSLPVPHWRPARPVRHARVIAHRRARSAPHRLINPLLGPLSAL